MRTLPPLLAFALMASPLLPGLATAQNELEPAFGKLKTLKWEDGRQDLNAIRKALQSDRSLEKRLGALLASNVPAAAKDFICRELSVYGTGASVPFLAPLLLDKELSHLSRFALERIGGAEASAALRKALPAAPGDLKLGIINSLGNIKDEKAVPLLADLLSQEPTAASARLALARIGTPEALRAIDSSADRGALNVEARLIVAEKRDAAGDKSSAFSMFQQIFSGTSEGAHKYGAFHGMLATGPAGEKKKLMFDALGGEDDRLRRIAGEWLAQEENRPILDEATTKFSSFPPKGQLTLLQALSTSAHTLGRSATRKALDSQDPEVRVAAIRNLARIGEAADLEALLERATGTQEQEKAAAAFALANLPGKKVDEELAKMLKSGRAGQREIILLQTLAARHSPGTSEVIQSRLRTPGRSRLAALAALAVLGDPGQISTLATLLADGDTESTQQVEKTIESIVERSAGQALEPLNEAFKNAPPASRQVLVRQFGIIAGPRALQAVRAAMKDSDPQVREEAFRVLSDWPGIGAAPDLLALAKNAEVEGWKPIALRNFIRLCRDGDMTLQQRLKGLADAAQLSRTKDQKLLLISALGTIPQIESARRLANYLDDAEVAETAGLTIAMVADKLPPQAAGEAVPMLKNVIEKCPQAAVQDRARASIAKLGGRS